MYTMLSGGYHLHLSTPEKYKFQTVGSPNSMWSPALMTTGRQINHTHLEMQATVVITITVSMKVHSEEGSICGASRSFLYCTVKISMNSK